MRGHGAIPGLSLGEVRPEVEAPREQGGANGACGALSDGEEGARLWNRQNGE